jgi:membrane-bound serine protease (ClpP class)
MDPIWTIVALLVGSLIVLFLEILTPTFGLLAILGVAGLVAAAWIAFMQSTTFGVLLSVGILIVVPGYLVALVKILPKTRVGQMLFLTQRDQLGKAEGNPEAELYEQLVGSIGVAETPLRPAGAVRVAGKRIDAMAEGGFIEKGEKVKIIRVSGPSSVVRKVEEA